MTNIGLSKCLILSVVKNRENLFFSSALSHLLAQCNRARAKESLFETLYSKLAKPPPHILKLVLLIIRKLKNQRRKNNF